LLICGIVFTAATAFAQAEQHGVQPASEPDLLPDMRQRAAAVSVTTLDGEPATPQTLREEPLFRYSDPRRQILDATLWGWGSSGRPVALMKAEAYPDERNGTRWVYCLASLSDQLIQADWSDGVRFRASEPGLQMSPLPDGPAPADTSAGRRLQFKRLTGRFAATIINNVDNRDQMRLMPTPICRYEDGDAGLVDGAIFGYTMGTNPDVLLVIELRESDEGVAWQYGCAGMTSAGYSIRLDGKEVFAQEFDPRQSGAPQAYPRWMWRRGSAPQ
jgi:hypothetical protein